MDTITTAKDGKTAVLITGKDFFMGSGRGYAEELPIHSVSLHDFYIDTKPVTNAEFKVFCDATGRGYPANPRWKDMPDYFLSYPDHPVVNVDWGSAAAYAAWAGKRLPTEEEWEYAASGGLSDENGAPLYPWGDCPPDGKKANYADKSSDFQWRDFSADDGWKYTSPVGSYEPNAFGLYDMSGNVFEWVDDWFFSYSDHVHDTDAFRDGWGGSRVCRGGCYHSNANDLRVSRRRQVLGGGANASVGFRCVSDVPGAEAKAPEYRPVPPVHEKDYVMPDPETPVVLPEEGFELCGGTGSVSPEHLNELKQLGFTSVEQYVTWESCENAGEGKWDFSHWDNEVAKIRAAGMKWLPFIIAGPAYSLPDWYRESRDFEGIVCVEHNIESKIQTLFDHNFHKYIERFLAAFAEHFSDVSIFEGLLFGITGDFGESIMSVWHGNWPTTIPGLYHAHAGYWCNDRFARADFREKMQEKYGSDLAALNASWETSFPTFGAVAFPHIQSDPAEYRIDEMTNCGTFIPKTDGERRHFVDFVDWYRGAMTEYVGFWMTCARKYFPDTELYMCTGGDAVPCHGSEFAAQTKVCAAVGGGVRITNEASEFRANFSVTNWVASAGNFYNSYFSFEPAGQVTERGIVCRVYNAAATGAKSLHYYTSIVTGGGDRSRIFAANTRHLTREPITRDIALLYPDVPSMLDMRRRWQLFSELALFRDYSDYLYACDVTIADGILDTVKALVIYMNGCYRAETLEKIFEFKRRGGILIGLAVDNITSLAGGDNLCDELFSGPRATVINECFANNPDTTRLCQQLNSFLSANGVTVTDGVSDRVYTAIKGGRLFVMNYSGATVTREFTLPDGSRTERTIPDMSIQYID